MSASRKIILYIAESLDGYIADENGGVGWLDEVNREGDYGYPDFLRSVDTLIMGRTTYEQSLTFGDWPYAGKKCYVFSKSKTEFDGRVEFVNSGPAEFVKTLKAQAGTGIWLVGGAKLIAAFLQARAIDEFIIFIVPVMLGRGIPLFIPGKTSARATLLDTERLGKVVRLHYLVTWPGLA